MILYLQNNTGVNTLTKYFGFILYNSSLFLFSFEKILCEFSVGYLISVYSIIIQIEYSVLPHLNFKLFYFRSRRKIPLGELKPNKAHWKSVPVEKDDRKLATRQRQIDIGKNTPGYLKYLEDVPRYALFF